MKQSLRTKMTSTGFRAILLRAALLMAIAGGSAVASAQEKVREQPNPDGTPGQAPGARARIIYEALQSPTRVDLHDVPLDVAMEGIAINHGIQIIFDTRALEDLGVDRSSPVSLGVSGISLNSALRLMLRPIELTTAVRDDVLTITSADEAELQLKTEVYSIADLVSGEGQDDWDVHSNANELIDIIVTSCAPSTWDEVGGPASIGCYSPNQSLVISQTSESQGEVAELLAAMRKAMDDQQHDGAQRALNTVRAVPASKSEFTERIRQSLQGETSLEFVETPISDVIADIAKKHNIPVIIDRRAMDDLGIDIASPITFSVKSVTLSSALDLILRQLDLAFVVRDEVLTITSMEEVESALTSTVFDVSTLVRADRDLDELRSVIQDTVAPTTWDAVGGAGTIAIWPRHHLLIVSQTDQVLQQTQELLKNLAANELTVAGGHTDSTDVIQRVYWLPMEEPAEKVVQTIRSMLGNAAWNSVESPYLDVLGKKLILRHSRQVHDEALKILDQLLQPPGGHSPVVGYPPGMMMGAGGEVEGGQPAGAGMGGMGGMGGGGMFNVRSDKE
ncbi:MAG: hypothetical protein R3E01_34230 [Pirellulaceae bacterium]